MYLNGSPRAVPIETNIEKTFGLRIEYQYLTNDARELGRMIYDSGITTYYNREIMDYALMRVEGGTMLIEAALLEDEKSYGRLRFTFVELPKAPKAKLLTIGDCKPYGLCSA